MKLAIRYLYELRLEYHIVNMPTIKCCKQVTSQEERQRIIWQKKQSHNHTGPFHIWCVIGKENHLGS